jgi:hypothetical protein
VMVTSWARKLAGARTMAATVLTRTRKVRIRFPQ